MIFSKLKIRQLIKNYIGGGWGKDEKSSDFPLPAYVIRGKDILEVNLGNIRNCQLRYHKKTNIEPRILSTGDIIFEVSGGSTDQNIGRTLYVSEKLLSIFKAQIIPASFCKKITPNQTLIIPKYLYYLLQELYDNKILSQWEVQSTGICNYQFEHFLNECEVQIPEIRYQSIVISYLSILDDLIFINKQRIKILEELVQLLFREWFIELRYPNYQEAKFVNKGFGLIPKDWTISTLKDHIKLEKGISYNGEGLTDEGNPMVNLNSISVDGRYVRGSEKPYSGNYKSRHILQPGDIVLANTDITQNGNVVGKAAFVPVLDSKKEIIFSHHIYAVRLDKNSYLKKRFMLNLLNSYNFHGHAKGYAVGTTVLGLSSDSIYRFSFPLPPEHITNQFEDNTEHLYQLIDNLENKNLSLLYARNLLLPRLMSGNIEVSNLIIPIKN